MNQKITGFHQDAEGHWAADLVCGHRQHVRHDPPMIERPWVLRDETRRQKVGTELNCVRCDEFSKVVAQKIQRACLQAVDEALLEASFAGLCSEGQQELIKDRIKSLDLLALSQEAIAESTTEFGVLS